MLLIEMANGYEEALLKIQTYLRENKENLSNTTINYLRQTMDELKESSIAKNKLRHVLPYSF